MYSGCSGFLYHRLIKRSCQDSKGNARSLSLDLYDQWETMEKDGKWRFTSPTHTVLAFAKALKELEAEGGIAKGGPLPGKQPHFDRTVQSMGMQPYIDGAHQGPVITTFFVSGRYRFYVQ